MVVIGSGATAVTLVPALTQKARHVTMLQRSPSYVVTRPQNDGVALTLKKWLPLRLAHQFTRWKNVLLGSFFYHVARTRPEMFRQRLLNMVQDQVGSDVDIRHFTPSYKPWDQRICAVPDGDLFHDLRAGRASVVTDNIERFTPGGILLSSGEELEADIIITATGLKLNALGGMALTVDGQPVTPGDCMSYKGMMLSDVPNLIITFGYTNASWTLKAELTSNYTCRLLRYMDRKGYRMAVPGEILGRSQAVPRLHIRLCTAGDGHPAQAGRPRAVAGSPELSEGQAGDTVQSFRRRCYGVPVT